MTEAKYFGCDKICPFYVTRWGRNIKGPRDIALVQCEACKKKKLDIKTLEADRSISRKNPMKKPEPPPHFRGERLSAQFHSGACMGNLLPFKRKDKRARVLGAPLLINEEAGRITSPHAPAHEDRGDVLARIKNKIDKINDMMREVSDVEPR